MQKGLSIALTLILVSFLAVPAAYVFLSHRSVANNVKGAATRQETNGIMVTVSSKLGTWDLFSILCQSENECTKSLTSGKPLQTMGGGMEDAHQVFIEYDPQWDQYNFLKLYVKPGWGSLFRSFSVKEPGDVPGTKATKISYEKNNYDVVIIPLSDIKSTFFNSAVIADN